MKYWGAFFLLICQELRADYFLVGPSAEWRYLDNGSDQGEFWRELDYDDGWWEAGEAELGYGDAVDGFAERTVIGYGTDANNKIITTYFRRRFAVTNLSVITNLYLDVLRDDGVVVYLNGEEVFRSNMPLGAVTYQTFALAAVPSAEEHIYHRVQVDPALLLQGTNIISAEVHQFSGNSPDLSFALQLIAGRDGTPPPQENARVIRGPYLQMATQTGVTVRWRTDVSTNSVVKVTNAANVEETISFVVEGWRVEHEVRVEGLSPQTKYLYSVGTTGGEHPVGGELTFVTVPNKAKPIRVWVIGDSGTATANARRVYESYAEFTGETPTDIWLMLGDNAYGSGTDAQYQRAVFETYPELLRTVAVWPTLGNHDTYSRDGNGNYPYLNIFSLPEEGEAGGVPSGTESYYSFNYGDIHFICLDSETSDRSVDGSMAEWLQSDLSANTSLWVIAFWHSPPYTKGSHDSDNPRDSGGRMVEMRENIVPILESYGVDLVLGGHSHIYERSFLLHGHYGYSDSLLPSMIKDGGSGRADEGGGYIKDFAEVEDGREGAVYVVAGSSGHATFRTGYHAVMHASLLEMGSLVIDVSSNRLDATFLRLDGVVRDEFTILKGAAEPEFKVTTFRVSGTIITGSWRSVPGVTYQLEKTLQLENPLWESLGAAIEATSATTSWTNTVDAAAGFLRVRSVQ